MHILTLTAVPHPKLHRLERVVHKHSGGKLDFDARMALLAKVEAGQPQVVARYLEEHVIHNAAAEFRVHGATVTESDDAVVAATGDAAG